jgi:hypothetical protein
VCIEYDIPISSPFTEIGMRESICGVVVCLEKIGDDNFLDWFLMLWVE